MYIAETMTSTYLSCISTEIKAFLGEQYNLLLIISLFKNKDHSKINRSVKSFIVVLFYI